MPKGGLRPRSSDGSTDHLIKPKWRSGETRTIRVPIALADQVLEIAHRIDEGKIIDLSQDNKTANQVKKPVSKFPAKKLEYRRTGSKQPLLAIQVRMVA